MSIEVIGSPSNDRQSEALMSSTAAMPPSSDSGTGTFTPANADGQASGYPAYDTDPAAAPDGPAPAAPPPVYMQQQGASSSGEDSGSDSGAAVAGSPPPSNDTNGDGGPELQPADSDGTSQPVVLNVVHDLDAGPGSSSGTIGLTGIGQTAGLGEIGTVANGDGLTGVLADVLGAPGQILSGNVTNVVSDLGTDLAGIVPTVTGLAGSLIPGDGATNLINDVVHAPGQILNGDVSGAVSDLTADLSGLAHTATGVADPVVPGGGAGNLIADVLDAPGQILSGDASGAVSDITTDLSGAAPTVTGLASPLTFGADPTNPVGDLVQAVGTDLQSTPLVTVNGGNNAGNGGLVGGVVGDLNPSSGGHVISADVGPEQSNGGLALDLLSGSETGTQHAATVNAIDTPAGTPQLLDVGLLTGSNGLLNVPSLGGAGTDGLAGNLLGNGVLDGPTASGNSAAVQTAPIDVDLVHDLVSAPLATDHGILDTHGAHVL